MILDNLLEFADATAIPTSTGTAIVGDVIDLGLANRNVGQSSHLYLVIQVDTAATSGGSATVAFHLVSDAQAALATDGTATYHWSSPALAVASITAGRQIVAIGLPSGTYERYLGVLATVATAALTAGKINAFITSDVSAWQAYPDAL